MTQPRVQQPIAVSLYDANGHPLLIRSDGAVRVENLPVDTDTIAEVTLNAVTATGPGSAIDIAGYRSLSCIVSGTWVGTVVPEFSTDGGITWSNLFMVNGSGGNVASLTSNDVLQLPAARGAFTHFRARVSAYTSGSITATTAKHPR